MDYENESVLRKFSFISKKCNSLISIFSSDIFALFTIENLMLNLIYFAYLRKSTQIYGEISLRYLNYILEWLIPSLFNVIHVLRREIKRDFTTKLLSVIYRSLRCIFFYTKQNENIKVDLTGDWYVKNNTNISRN